MLSARVLLSHTRCNAYVARRHVYNVKTKRDVFSSVHVHVRLSVGEPMVSLQFIFGNGYPVVVLRRYRRRRVFHLLRCRRRRHRRHRCGHRRRHWFGQHHHFAHPRDAYRLRDQPSIGEKTREIRGGVVAVIRLVIELRVARARTIHP